MRQSQHSNYRFFIAAMGPGEIGQGMAFAGYALGRGDFVVFAIPRAEYLPLVQLQNPRFSSLITENSVALKEALCSKKIDALILCNSKIFTRNDNFPKYPPEPKLPSLSIDSNWLFGPSSPYLSNPWVDRYCLNLPEPIFQMGLKKNGGHYVIPKKILEKISVVGLIPSYRPLSVQEKNKIRAKYGIHKNEKLIFLYTSMGSLEKPRVFLKAYAVVKKLRAKGKKVKVIYFGDPPSAFLNAKDRDWFLARPRTNTEHFSKVLASSDLVFQHQGLATMEQAIGAQVPVIANVRDRKDEKNPTRHMHAWEVGPFAKYGACAMFFSRNSISTVANCSEGLLFNKNRREAMRQKQHALYGNGEKKVYNEAIKLLKTKS
ncbi:hypothetical protein KKE19_02525 [Patescibacteria group bacterium]|nr:hypothetical protein [Patescibacteria group bacterium]MBU4274665.1 hypothetical protein [Patescibacteria group bacterium]MBU4367711.1 hypothetical protein [Patescibacteria group bacterium]MBU4461839.1 hypothetical protein [Patescibacteria group bacterium]MCG2700030.1 DUF6365 family protein [Candidatus Parcubacteria bacterium]